MFDRIIKPEGWEIPQATVDIHGITFEHAMDVGVSEKSAVEEFLALADDYMRVGHNENFDARILRIALKRYFSDELADEWKAKHSDCTARLTRAECALPKSKVPTLIEAYRHFYGEDYANPHNALADARACKSVYMAHMFGVKIAA